MLTVSTSPDFAAKWLVNRLGHFLEAHPEIDLRVSATMHHVDFAREDVDVAVRHGEGNWPGLDAVRLSPEELFPVCSPKLMSGARAIREPADLLKHPLLHMEDRQNWARWLATAGIADAGAVHGPVLNRASMLIDAAVDGQGVALARTTLAAWDLINGRLVRPFGIAVPLIEDLLDRLPQGDGRRCRRSQPFATGCWPRPPMTRRGSRSAPPPGSSRRDASVRDFLGRLHLRELPQESEVVGGLERPRACS